MSDTTLNQNQNSAVFNDYQARANSFADYAAIAALAPSLVAKNAKIQAAAEQDLQATEPQIIGTYEPMSKHSFADNGAIATFVESFANVYTKRESSLSALAEAAENHSKSMAKSKPSFFEKLLNTPITYSFRPNFGGIA